jgi:hypothetical protein
MNPFLTNEYRLDLLILRYSQASSVVKRGLFDKAF